MCSLFSVDHQMKTFSMVIPGAVLIPENGDDVTMIGHIVQAEPVPGIFRYQRIDLDDIIWPWTEPDHS